MPRRHVSLSATRRHCWINDEDWDFLQQQYGPGTASNSSAGQMIRKIVGAYTRKVREAANKLTSTGDQANG